LKKVEEKLDDSSTEIEDDSATEIEDDSDVEIIERKDKRRKTYNDFIPRNLAPLDSHIVCAAHGCSCSKSFRESTSLAYSLMEDNSNINPECACIRMYRFRQLEAKNALGPSTTNCDTLLHLLSNTTKLRTTDYTALGKLIYTMPLQFRLTGIPDEVVKQHVYRHFRCRPVLNDTVMPIAVVWNKQTRDTSALFFLVKERVWAVCYVGASDRYELSEQDLVDRWSKLDQSVHKEKFHYYSSLFPAVYKMHNFSYIEMPDGSPRSGSKVSNTLALIKKIGYSKAKRISDREEADPREDDPDLNRILLTDVLMPPNLYRSGRDVADVNVFEDYIQKPTNYRRELEKPLKNQNFTKLRYAAAVLARTHIRGGSLDETGKPSSFLGLPLAESESREYYMYQLPFSNLPSDKDLFSIRLPTASVIDRKFFVRIYASITPIKAFKGCHSYGCCDDTKCKISATNADGSNIDDFLLRTTGLAPFEKKEDRIDNSFQSIDNASPDQPDDGSPLVIHRFAELFVNFKETAPVFQVYVRHLLLKTSVDEYLQMHYAKQEYYRQYRANNGVGMVLYVDFKDLPLPPITNTETCTFKSNSVIEAMSMMANVLSI
jgi:hypothetical protein